MYLCLCVAVCPVVYLHPSPRSIQSSCPALVQLPHTYRMYCFYAYAGRCLLMLCTLHIFFYSWTIYQIIYNLCIYCPLLFFFLGWINVCTLRYPTVSPAQLLSNSLILIEKKTASISATWWMKMCYVLCLWCVYRSVVVGTPVESFLRISGHSKCKFHLKKCIFMGKY